MASKRPRYKKPLRLHEIVEELENASDDESIPSSIAILPPENANADVTDEDSGEEDNVTLHNLPGSQLRAEAVTQYSDSSDEEDNIPLSELSKARRTEIDDLPTTASSSAVDVPVHDCTFAPDISIVLKETLPVLERAVRDGKARYIGLADYDIDLMKEVIEESGVKISTILSYAKSTLHDNRLQNYTKYFKSKGVGVINAAATGMGLLSNHGPQRWHPASDDIKAICKRASDYCKEQNVELARLATWFTLNQPDIDTNICGFYNIEQLRDTLDVLDNGLTAHEQQVLHDVQLRFFDNVVLHWDNAELPVYKAKLNAIQNNK